MYAVPVCDTCRARYPISNVEHSSLLLQVGLPHVIADAIANTKFNTSCKFLISPRRARFVFSKSVQMIGTFSFSFIYATSNNALSGALNTTSIEYEQSYCEVQH